MIAATRSIVALPLRRGAPAARPTAAQETSFRGVVETVHAARFEAPRAIATLPMSPFVAQLIATYQAVPQTRARHRAELANAASAYRAAAAISRFQ